MSVSPLPTCRKLRPTCGEVFASGQTMPVQPAAAGDAERSCDLLARATCASSRPKRHDAHITSHRIHIGRITMNESSMWSERVLIGPQKLEGDLVVPPCAWALIVFAHGSGSTRHSPRNVQVARALQRRQFGTLLFDLLRPDEASERRHTFDIELLARRLCDTIEWLDRRPSLAALPIGLFGASTGAAAALVAAARHVDRVFAVVSRGGRPDLASAMLGAVKAPALLIVGGADTEVLALIRAALGRLNHRSELAVVPHATHLFEESGALERVAQLAGDWFVDQMMAR